MNCNDLYTCKLTPVLYDLRKNADDDHEAANAAEFMDTHQKHVDAGDSFDTADGDLHFLQNYMR